MTAPLVNRTHRFVTSGVTYQVEAGASCSTVLSAAGSILTGVNILLGNLIDEADEQGCELFVIRSLTMQVEALLDSVEIPIRSAEDLAPQNAAPPIRGAEVSE